MRAQRVRQVRDLALNITVVKCVGRYKDDIVQVAGLSWVPVVALPERSKRRKKGKKKTIFIPD